MISTKARQWLDGVLADPRLDETDRLVARAIAGHMDDRGRVDGTDDDVAAWVAELIAGDQ